MDGDRTTAIKAADYVNFKAPGASKRYADLHVRESKDGSRYCWATWRDNKIKRGHWKGDVRPLVFVNADGYLECEEHGVEGVAISQYDSKPYSYGAWRARREAAGEWEDDEPAAGDVDDEMPF